MIIPVLAAVLLVLGLVLYFASEKPKVNQVGYLCIAVGLLGLVLAMTHVLPLHT